MQLTKKEWNRNKEIYIWIFNVGRGFSSFIKTPHNYGVMVDCGRTDDFAPFEDVIKKRLLNLVDCIKDRKLAQVIITHPHSDHCLEIKEILTSASPYLLTSPHANQKERDERNYVNWDLVDNPEYSLDSITILKKELNNRQPPLKAYLDDIDVIIPGFEMKIFFIPPRFCEYDLPKNDYCNNLSIITYMKLGNNSILFMGDLMPSGCEYLLSNNKDFRSIIEGGISVFVAPHHGLESAFYKPVFDAMPSGKVEYVNIISDKISNQSGIGTTDKRYLSSILAHGYHGKYSFSTKNDGHIRIIIGTGNKVEINSSFNVEDLLI